MSVFIANRHIFATNTAKSINKFQIRQNTGESVSCIGFKREMGGTAWNTGAPVKYWRSGSLIRQLRSIRQSLTTDAIKTLVYAFVSSHIDYWNSILAGVNSQLLQRLQSVQNEAACLVTGARRSDRITPILRQLHWLVPGTVSESLKDDRQRFLQQVSKKQFRTVYHNANAYG